jgi:uncharacterized repeat protein (TIGR03943 family)
MGAAVNRPAQAIILTAIGGVALRVGITDEHTRYVNEWMRWPLVVSGILLVGLAFTSLLRRYDDDHPTTPAAWALLIPVVVAFVVQPPALGSYVAERRVNDVAAASYDKASVMRLAEGETADLLVSEFVGLASAYGEILEGQEVRLRGFVTRDEGGWYVTRLTMRCCAADSAAFRVRVDGALAPPKEQWVEVVGTWVEGTGTESDPSQPPTLAARDVTPTAEPKQHYE